MGLRTKAITSNNNNNTNNSKSNNIATNTAIGKFTINNRNGGPNYQMNTKFSSSIKLRKSPTKTSIANSKQERCSNLLETSESETLCITRTKTTYRSSSSSALMAATANCMRPQTLNVHNSRQTPTDHTQTFLSEILNAWRAKARCNVEPSKRTQELFHELSFNLSEKQICEMLQTAKMLARKGSRQSNGLTFGEFCVLAADLKRFRTSTFSSTICDKVNLLSSLQHELDNKSIQNCSTTTLHANMPPTGTELRNTKSFCNVEDCKATIKSNTDTTAQVEVFLGGSCNPTTWRADVAIPTLKKLGISFYNPQVLDWTPDLIELEHRAKEKARVLFFVMDSETRASAGAIEAAHIAGQNYKQLVLVLHPYKPNQFILNEPISQQEYYDLIRNQLILKELVTRRGLPVLDNIPSGLQRTKEILSGIRDPPSNIASILVVVRGAFDRVSPVNDVITVEQCQRALLYLGYAQSLLSSDNLNKIIASQRESYDLLQKRNTKQSTTSTSESIQNNLRSQSKDTTATSSDGIDFNLFCIVSAYLSVLQQEIHESGCISPIKGTNVPPPPVYLTNMQGMSYYTSKNISRTSSNTSVPSNNEERNSMHEILSRSRDSGTSSPQPLETLKMKISSGAALDKNRTQFLVNVESVETPQIAIAKKNNGTIENVAKENATSGLPSKTITTEMQNLHPAEDESDSNDSVFSSSSSINSMNFNYSAIDAVSYPNLDFRDVYLGGSCMLRTKWRQNIAVPYLNSNNVSYHLPALHESIQYTSQLGLSSPTKAFEDPQQQQQQQQQPQPVVTTGTSVEEHKTSAFIRRRRKCRNVQNEAAEKEEEQITVAEETSFSWIMPTVRANLYNPALLESSRVLLFVITNETRSLAPMTLAAHCIGLMYNVVLVVQMLPENCVISNEKLTPAAIKDYNRGRAYLIDLANRQGIPVFKDLKEALACTVEKVKACNSRQRYD